MADEFTPIPNHIITTPKPMRAFAPQPDITAFELASIFGLVGVQVDADLLSERPEVLRHFGPVIEPKQENE